MLGGVEMLATVSCISVSEPVRAAKRRSSISSSVMELKGAEGMLVQGLADYWSTTVSRQLCRKHGKRSCLSDHMQNV